MLRVLDEYRGVQNLQQLLTSLSILSYGTRQCNFSIHHDDHTILIIVEYGDIEVQILLRRHLRFPTLYISRPVECGTAVRKSAL